MRHFWYRKNNDLEHPAQRQGDLPNQLQVLDQQIVRIQKSTKTSFKYFSEHHVLLRQKYPWYYRWHLKPYAGHIHAAVVILALATAAFASTSIILHRPAPAAAAAVTCYWVGDTSPANWNDATHWSSSAGGSGSTCDTPATVPGNDDIAIFTSNITNDVTVDAAVDVKGLTIQSGYSGTINQGANTVTVGTSNFSQAGGVFAGSGSAIIFNGTWTLTGGSFTASTGTTTFKSYFTHNVATGTFAHNNGTVATGVTSSGSSFDVNTTENFYDFTWNNNDGVWSQITRGDTLVVNNNLILNNGKIGTIASGVLNPKKGITVNNTFDGGFSTLLIDGAIDQSFTVPVGANLPSFNLNNSLTTVNFAAGATPTIGVFTLQNGTFTCSDTSTTFTDAFYHTTVTGTFNHNSATAIFSGWSRTFDVNTSETFNNVQIYKLDVSYLSIVTADKMIVDGTLTLTDGGAGDPSNGGFQGTIDANSTVSVANTFDGGAGTLLLDNSAVNQSFTIPSGTIMMGINLNNTNAAPTTINFAAGATATIQGAFTLINGVFTASSGTTTFQHNFTHNVATGTFNHNSGTVKFSWTTAGKSIDVNTTELFNNVEFNSSSNSYSIAAGDSIEVDGTLTLTDGPVHGGTINADGTVSVGPLFDGGGSTLLIDNSAIDQSFTIPDSAQMMGINLNNTNAAPTTINFAVGANVPIEGDFTLINGTFTCSSGATTFNGDFTHNVATGTFNHNNGTVNFNSSDSAGTSYIDVNTTEALNNVEFNATVNNYLYTISAGDSVVVAGSLALTEGKVHGPSGTINAQGAVTIANTFDGGTGILKFSGGNTQTYTDNGGVKMSGGPIVIDKTVGTAVNLATAMALTTAGQDLTITSGTLDLSSFALTLTAAGDVLTVGANGTLRLEGGETITASTKTLNAASTVYYDGAGVSYTLKPYSYSNLTINGGAMSVFSSGANITGAATVTLTSGILATAGFDLTATTLSNTSTLQLQGNEANVTFTNMDTDSGIVVYRGRNVSETLTVKDLGGADADYYILNISDVNPTKATFQLGADLDVNRDLTISTGNTLNTSASNYNVNVGAYWTNNGSYISNSNTTTFDGSGGNIVTGGTGATQDFYNFVLSAGTRTVTTNGLDVDGTLTLTNGTLNMNTQPLTANGAYTQTNGTFTGSTNSLTFGGAWTLSGGTFTATNGTTTFNNNFTHTAGGTFTHNSGAVKFNASDGRTIDVNATELFNNVEFNASSSNYYSISSGDSIEVDGTLTLTNGSVNGTTGTINADSTVSVADTFDGGLGILLLDNSTIDQSFTIPNGASMMGINLNNTNAAPTTINFAVGANAVIQGIFTLINGTFICSNSTTTFQRDFTHNVATGTFNHNNGTVNFNANGSDGRNINVNTTETFNNIEFNAPTGNYYIIAGGDSIEVDGTLTLTNGLVYGTTGTLDAKGHVTIANTFDGGTGILKFSGGNDQTFTDNGGVMMTGGPVVIDKTIGKAVNLATNMAFASAGQDLTITSGTLDLVNHNLTLTAAGDVLTIDTNATLRLEGGGTVTASTKTINAGSTVYYDGTGGPYTLQPWTYSNLTIDGTGGTFELGAALDVNRNLSITSGTLGVSAGNHQINVAGDWAKAGTFTAGSGTVVFDGGDLSTQAISGSTDFYNFTATTAANAAGRTLTFADSSTQNVTGTWTITGSAGKVITMARAAASAPWTIHPTAASVTYTDVSWSTNTGVGFCATFSHDGGDNTGWQIAGGGSCGTAPVNDSLTFTNPYSGTGTTAVADDTTSWTFRAMVTDVDGPTNLDYVELGFANSSGSVAPYGSLRFRWTEATNTFSEEADTQNAATITSVGADATSAGNQWTINFKIKINNNFSAKDTLYAIEIYSIDDGALNATTDYPNIYQVTALSLTLGVSSGTVAFGNLLPGSVLTSTTVASVTTNFPNGYTLAASDSVVGTGSALLHTDMSTRVADYTDPIAAPTLWSGTGLGVCVYNATNKEVKWGTGVAENDANNKYAGVPETTTEIHAKTGAPTSSDGTSIGYKVVVPNTQKTGNYSGIVTYTATGVLL